MVTQAPVLSLIQKTIFLGLCTQKPFEAYQYLAKHGKLAGVATKQGNLFLVNDDELMMEMLLNTESFLRGMDPSSPYSNGLFTADGQLWKQLREAAKPKFKQSSIREMSQAIETIIHERMNAWHKKVNGQLDITQEMMELTLDIFVGTMFGLEAKKETEQFIGIWRELINATAENPITPEDIFINQVTPDEQTKSAFDQLETLITQIWQKRQTSAIEHDDLFECIIAGAEETCGDDKEAIRKQVVTQVLTFLIASHETTSASMTWLFLMVSEHPDVESYLVSEISSHFTEEFDYKTLPFTQAVVKETLRLYPPAWYISRLVLKETQLGEFLIPPNSRLDVSILDIHRNPDKWTEPLSFVPARFLGAKPKVTDYLPFGAGARRCIGDHLALLEMVMITAFAFKQFTFKSINGAQIKPAQMVMRADKNFIVHIEKR